jgi:hypothetical protein
MTFQEIRIIATGPCIANQLQDVTPYEYKHKSARRGAQFVPIGLSG